MRTSLPLGRIEKVIVNIVNDDHGMRDTVVWVSGLWETELEDEHGAVPVSWNLDSSSYGGTLPTTDVEVKFNTAINYNNRNWS